MLRLGTSPTTVRRMASAHESVFRREGEYWTLAYAGNVVTLRDTKGMHDLAVLLARPGQEVHALDLARAAEGVTGVVADADRGIEVIDDRARDEYRDRLATVEQELEEAQSFGDELRAAKLREEAELLTEELAAAYGLGGRSRTTGDAADRARKAVGRRVRDALERIERAHPPLGAHLRAAVKLGTFCSYEPESPITWIVGD